MGQWVLVVALVAAVAGVAAWLWLTGRDGPRPPGRRRLPVRLDRLRARFTRDDDAAPAGLAVLTRRVLDEVVALGDQTMRDRALILPHVVTVHVHPDDFRIVADNRDVIERDVRTEIIASGERHGWVSKAPLRIVHVANDPAITRGRPMVQRAPVDAGGRLPRDTDPVFALRSTDGQVAVPVPPGGGSIGRDSTRCTMVITGTTVSREHARLEPLPDGFAVRDLGSANGVSVNGTRCVDGVLRENDVLGLGRSVLLRLERVGSEAVGR